MARTAKQNGSKHDACIQEGCPNPEARRGLCEGCYRAARRKILEGSETWASLEQQGYARPLNPRGTAFARNYARKSRQKLSK